MPAASFPTATAGAQPTGDEATAIPFLTLHFSNSEHCENLPATDTRSIWPVKPRAGGGPPSTKEFDFGPLRLELVRQAA